MSASIARATGNMKDFRPLFRPNLSKTATKRSIAAFSDDGARLSSVNAYWLSSLSRNSSYKATTDSSSLSSRLLGFATLSRDLVDESAGNLGRRGTAPRDGRVRGTPETSGGPACGAAGVAAERYEGKIGYETRELWDTERLSAAEGTGYETREL